MGKVNIEELERQSAKLAVSAPSIPSKLIGGKRIFEGAEGEWFDSLGEALDSRQKFNTQKLYRELGLDEEGRTPQQVERNNKIRELIAQRDKLIEQIRQIEAKVTRLRNGLDLEPEAEEVKEKKEKVKK